MTILLSTEISSSDHFFVTSKQNQLGIADSKTK